MLNLHNFKSAVLALLGALILLTGCGINVDVAQRQHESGFYFNVSKTSTVEDNKKEREEVDEIHLANSNLDEIASNRFDEGTAISEKHDIAKKDAIDGTSHSTANIGTPDASDKSSNKESKHQIVSEKATSSIFSSPISHSYQNNIITKASDDSGNGTGKSQMIALLLVVMVGALGIHRFYLGYTTIGIIQLLTGGGCGVWALIDLVRIITGDLQPKDGPYDETL